MPERGSDLVRSAASGDLAAVEKIRELMAEEPGVPPRFDGGRPDARRRPQGASVAEFAGSSPDDLTIKLIANWLRASGAPPAPAPELVLAPRFDVAATKSRRGLRLPWAHRGRRHPGLG